MSQVTREFTGKWITAEEFCDLEPVNVFHRQLDKKEIITKAPGNSHILFRKKFNINKSENNYEYVSYNQNGSRNINQDNFINRDNLGKVYIYISADDYYKLYLNGRFVCQGPAPGYPFHYYYNKVDITEYVHEGENTIAVHTYYQGLINRVWVSGDDRHGLILDIEQDGEVILSSDESFLYSYHSGFEAMGKCGYETQFLERYTSSTIHEGFEKCTYCTDELDDDSIGDEKNSVWKHSKIRRYTDYQLYEQPTKMLEFERIEPQKLKWDGNGVTIDFGSNYVGYFCAEACGNKGDVIELLYGQELKENKRDCDDSDDSDNSDNSAGYTRKNQKTVRWQMRSNCNYREEWVLSGKNDTLNQFDYKSFRYVRINLPDRCKIKSVYLNARHYPFELKAIPDKEAVSKYPDLLKIWDLCVNTLKYGVQEVIQDCMEREKGNYLGDGCYTALAYTVLTGDASMLKKLIDDSLRSSFINKGLMTCAACSFMQEIAEYPLMMYYALYTYYEMTGDLGYLEEKYVQLVEVLDYYRDKYSIADKNRGDVTDKSSVPANDMAGSGLLSNLDKWCVVEWPANYRDDYDVDITEGKVCTETHNVINAHYLGAIKYMNKISEALDKPQYYDEKNLLDAFLKAFYNGEKKLFKDSVTTEHISLISNGFPLMYGLYNDKETEESIVRLIEDKGFTSVMLFGAYPILAGLKRVGRKDLMYKCLLDDEAWLRMLREGATTTFEGWGKDCKWNTSLFHLTLSYAVLFLCNWDKKLS